VTGPAIELADVQGLVTWGYRDLRAARAVLLQVGAGGRAGAWLASLLAEVTNATSNPTESALNVAFTPRGLARLGLPAGTLGMFPEEFTSGPTRPHRALVLGDVEESAPERWVWGGPGTPGFDALLLLYARDPVGLAELAGRQSAAWQSFGLSELWSLPSVDLGAREHFGFHDGVSQPLLEGLPKQGRSDDTISAGEVLLGYPNGYGLYTDRPSLPPEAPSAGLLPSDLEGSGRRDLGRNGTYLVLRQLVQDVERFWSFVEGATRRPDGTRDEAAATWLAAKMVGRWPSGASMVLAPLADDPSLADANDFRYFQADADGTRCPVGSHVRRSNPRDSLDPQPGSDASVAVGKRHRIIRRGRSYGAPGGTEERGLLFACLCANIARQFEFIQHSWVNNPKFSGLYDDADPLLGAHQAEGATFTVQEAPVRRRFQGLPRFVSVRGGGYFFLPGLRALRYLASLGGTA
jgi:Dyp-type peroxidase family